MEQVTNTCPKAGWQFACRNSLLWILTIFTALVGSVAVAVIEHLIFSTEWELREFMSDSKMEFFFLSFPYLWILLLALLLLAAWQEVRHTKRGYRYGLLTIAAVIGGTSLISGTVLFATGVGEGVDANLATKFPNYTKHVHAAKARWHKPSIGQVMGTVVKAPVTTTFSVTDIHGNEWVIITNTGTLTHFIDVTTGTRVRIFGTQESQHLMAAHILPTTVPKEHIEQMKQELYETRDQYVERRKQAAQRILNTHRVPPASVKIERYPRATAR